MRWWRWGVAVGVGVCLVAVLLCVQQQQQEEGEQQGPLLLQEEGLRMPEFYVPTLFSRLQSSFQAATRPALWLSPITHLHSSRKEWVMKQTSMDEAVNKILAAATANAKKFQLAEPIVAGRSIQVLSYTKAEWLDVMEFELQPTNQRDVLVKAHSFSSGLVPVAVPGAPILNMATFFFPFLDHGLNRKRLKAFQQHTTEQ